MTATNLRVGRENKGWTQQQAAERLGVSQGYLSLLENGTRRLTERLARRARALYDLSPTVLPVRSSGNDVYAVEESGSASDLAALGYPGFSYLTGRKKKNPAEVVVSLLKARDLEARLTEALPWVLLEYPDLDWNWLVKVSKLHDLQNRLGFVTTLALRVAEAKGNKHTSEVLAQQRSNLERSRLAREDTLCHELLSEAEKNWLRENRPPAARHWNLLTDLSVEHLNYGT